MATKKHEVEVDQVWQARVSQKMVDVRVLEKQGNKIRLYNITTDRELPKWRSCQFLRTKVR